MKEDFFHILNRGVEKRKIFLDKEDYLRFIHNMEDFNNANNIIQSYYRRRNMTEVSSPSKKSIKKLVDILCWCLMPNHPHLYVQEKIDGGASVYIKKLTGGYTMYFNLKNKRSGTLFQGRSKIIRIERNEHFTCLPFYIFSNPIKLIEPKWKENGIKNLKKVMEFLENYKWSSYSDLIGKNNFPEVINKKLFYETYDTNEKQLKKDFTEWLRGFKGEFENFEDYDNY